MLRGKLPVAQAASLSIDQQPLAFLRREWNNTTRPRTVPRKHLFNILLRRALMDVSRILSIAAPAVITPMQSLGLRPAAMD